MELPNFIEHQYNNSESTSVKRWAKSYMDKIICPSCNGSRLNEIASFFKIHNKSIADLTKMDINDLLNWFNELPKNLRIT